MVVVFRLGYLAAFAATEILAFDWNGVVTKADHGFANINHPNLPNNTNWVSPTKFVGGTVHIRVELRDMPTTKNLKLQTGVWQSDTAPGSQRPSWANHRYHEQTTGQNSITYTKGKTYIETFTQIQSSMWVNKATHTGEPINWAWGRHRMGMVVKNSSSKAVSDFNGWNWNGENPDEWYPMDVRWTVVFVAPGETFSGWSNYISDGGESESNPPSAPSNLTATANSSTEVTLSWSDNSESEAGYRIDRRIDGSSAWDRISEPEADATSYADNGLLAETKYYYKVKAYSGDGESAESNVADVTTQVVAGVPPTAPSNIAASAPSTSQVNITWSDNSDNEDGFKVERRVSGSQTWSEIASKGIDSVSHTDDGVVAGTKYFYKVKAMNGHASSAYSATAEVTTPEEVPEAPSDLEVKSES